MEKIQRLLARAYIKSDNGQPLAVTYPQQLKNGSSVVALMESSKNGEAKNTAYAPLVQNYNLYYQIVSGIAAQNTSATTRTIQRRFRGAPGTICKAWFSKVAPRHSVIDILPPGLSSRCPSVLSARVKNLSSVGVSATINQFWSGFSPYPHYWTDYPAIPNPSTAVIIPWWRDTGGWDSAMVIRNAAGSRASGHVRFFYANGNLAGPPVPFSVPGNGYTIVDAPVSGLSGSAKVTASQKVAVIVNHFNSSGGGDKIMSNAGDHKP